MKLRSTENDDSIPEIYPFQTRHLRDEGKSWKNRSRDNECRNGNRDKIKK